MIMGVTVFLGGYTRCFHVSMEISFLYLQVNKGVTVVDLLSFARELEAQTDLMVNLLKRSC